MIGVPDPVNHQIIRPMNTILAAAKPTIRGGTSNPEDGHLAGTNFLPHGLSDSVFPGQLGLSSSRAKATSDS